MSTELGLPEEGIEARAVVVRGGQALLAMLSAVVAGSVLTPTFESAGTALGFAADSATVAVFGTAGNAVGLTAAGLLFLLYAGDLDILRFRMPTRREALVAVAGAAGLTVAGYAILYGFAALGLTPSTNRALENPPAYFLAMIPLSFVTVAVAEEVVFRGVVQGELRRALGPAGAVAGASLLFGTLHYLAGVGTPTQRAVYVAVAATLSLGLGALYEYTDNLVVPIVVHGAYNAVQYVIQYLSATGGA
ncbi:CPBP family intramembrane metalloprotease [Halobaculum sp. CBA1158]|uniref:CPBP family intramembrane glutamic endopeptidase n=1 Tax=Halobaculum sp. CBA1158 TaxID=2904243 RepID=UPI001F3B1E55|nr:CPBP family intramembrane glutamic endopeptidase [Halobaculum sp. CBA1158]UIO99606.1 CPBP family intramembrane metalloprotease [Halobaculum sp. CBA1158]